jgi:diguanylate cyclase (GGDEF)-like protein
LLMFAVAMRKARHGAARWAAAAALGLAFAGAAPAAAPAPADPPALVAQLQQLQYESRVRPDTSVPRWSGLLPQLTPHPALHIEALMALGSAQAVVNDLAGVERSVEALRALALQQPAPTSVWAHAGAELVQAQLLRRQGPVGRADRLLGAALAGLPSETPSALRLRFVSTMAGLKSQGGKLEDAVRLYQEALGLAEAAAAPPWRRVDLRSGLANALFEAGQLDRAILASRQALDQAQAAKDPLALSLAYTVEGIVLADTRPAEAQHAMQAALRYAQQAAAERDEVLAIANLADISLRRADYREALAYSERALPLARRLQDEDAQSVALANIGFAQIMLGRKDEGLRNARASLALDEQTGSMSSLLATHTELAAYLERAGHLAEAYAARREQRRLSELLFRRDQQQAVIELQESFDHEQRQRALALLEAEGRVQQAQLVSRQLQSWLWAAGAAIAVLLLALASLLARRVRAGNAQLAQTNARLSELSRRDALTGLANRRHFHAAVQASGQAQAFEGTLMLIDIDHFKQVNDRFGHAAGDAVLVEVARRLRAALRDDDLIVRWGGEEFLLVVRTVQRAEVDALVGRLLHALAAQPVRHGKARVSVSASIGFASFPLAPSLLTLGVEQAIDLVDTAMYLAKAHGRHRACGVRRAEAADAAALAALAQDLEGAWRAGKVELSAIVGPSAPPLLELVA